MLSTLKGWKYGFNSPFKAEVYFVNTKQYTDLKWGTQNPIMLRDKEFGPIRLRAFGNYCIRIAEADKFIKEIVGTDGHFTSDEITNQLRNLIITRFTDLLGESGIPALDLASNYNELSDFVLQKISQEFADLGLNLTKLLVENISLPEEVEKAIDKRSSMGVIGDLNKYSQFQAAEAMEDAAKNPGGMAAGGMGMGMGFAMANQMGQAMSSPQQADTPQQPASAPQTPPPLPPSTQYFVAVNGQQQGPFSVASLKPMVQSAQLTKATLVGVKAWQTGRRHPKSRTSINCWLRLPHRCLHSCNPASV